MRPFRQSRAPRLTAAVCTSDEEEQDTGQFTSPILLLLSVLIPLNYFRQKYYCANATILILPLIGSRDRRGELSMSFILIRECISIHKKLWMRFTNLRNLICMTAAPVKMRISLVNLTTSIYGAIPGGAKELQRIFVRSVSRAIAMQASEFQSLRLRYCSSQLARMIRKAIDAV